MSKVRKMAIGVAAATTLMAAAAPAAQAAPAQPATVIHGCNAGYYATVYYNSGCNGSFASQTFGAYASANFDATMKNENASFKCRLL